MKVGTLLDFIQNDSAWKKYLREMGAKVTKDVDLPKTSKPADTLADKVILNLDRLWLRQTPDTPQERQKLISRASNEVRNLVQAKGIARLSAEGIIFDSQCNVVLPGYNLVGQIWH